MRPGQPARHDCEYRRNGTATLFMLFAPLEGWRHVEVTHRRTAVDYAKILRDLSDVHFPMAEKIVLVQDNLHTHTPGQWRPRPVSERWPLPPCVSVDTPQRRTRLFLFSVFIVMLHSVSRGTPRQRMSRCLLKLA